MFEPGLFSCRKRNWLPLKLFLLLFCPLLLNISNVKMFSISVLAIALGLHHYCLPLLRRNYWISIQKPRPTFSINSRFGFLLNTIRLIGKVKNRIDEPEFPFNS